MTDSSNAVRLPARPRFAPIWRAYAWALTAALVSGWWCSQQSVLAHPLLVAGIADLVGTLVIFGFSQRNDNASFYDPYWSVAPPLLVGYFFWAYAGTAPVAGQPLRQVLIVALVGAWAWRLTHNWARGWHGLHHEDWRYVDLKATTGRWWPVVNWTGVHLFPTLLVFAGCLSAYVVAAHLERGWNAWDVLAVLIGGAAVAIETVADNQLRRHRQTQPAVTLLETGVWGWCRHPNYLGELGFWLALWLFAWAAAPSAALRVASIGPVLMLALFVGISIPMIERRLAVSRPAFVAHRRRSFALFPASLLVWPRR